MLPTMLEKTDLVENNPPIKYASLLKDSFGYGLADSICYESSITACSDIGLKAKRCIPNFSIARVFAVITEYQPETGGSIYSTICAAVGVAYNEIIEQHLQEGIIEKAPNPAEGTIIHYLPHHGLIKPSEDSTKASDQVYRGPVLLPEHRFCHVSFRVVSSPFLLAALLETPLKGYPEEKAIDMNLYVDDIFVSAENSKEAGRMHKRIREIFNEASMNVREFASNEKRSAHEEEEGIIDELRSGAENVLDETETKVDVPAEHIQRVWT
ncbi:unnamed protein product [Toxocara canis]|uniref:Reverse transcriptase domain-containing protein n=1 Tax=Toxocara canis TaxID=6265 RepID=A0A183UUW8_TOXCA|nr:unnamed protein product [Toxocara canis]